MNIQHSSSFSTKVARYGRGAVILKPRSGFLADAQIEAATPSVFAQEAHASRISKFNFHSTRELLGRIQAVVENLQRLDVTPLEEADAFARLVEGGLTAEEIASKTGAALFRVKWRLQLCNLESGIRKLFEGGHLDRQQAMEIARLDDHAAQVRILGLVNRGQLTGWKAVRNAVEQAMGVGNRPDLFGAGAPKPSDAEVETLSSMESKIDRMAGAVSAGWRDGECVIASRVSPDRAQLMADKLAALQKCLKVMERDLRNVSAEAFAAMV